MSKVKTKKKTENPRDILRNEVSRLILPYCVQRSMPSDIPTKWEKHGDLILLSGSCFQDSIWLNLGDKLWSTIATVLKANRVARKNRVQNDNYRSPTVEILKGLDGWVLHIDNKIKYTYDITKCMFSSGNITEKLRVAQLSCIGETVVDLYAGIGYFTLPFLIHAKASFVHACEWNSHAIEALEKNLILNGVREKCTIHFGDNREVCLEKVADRVNLGLIPTSEPGWETACRALKPKGGILHIHGNVTSYSETRSQHPEWNTWAQDVSSAIKNIFLSLYKTEWTLSVIKITRVKSYAPHIDHLVLDVECRPLEKDVKYIFVPSYI